MDRQSGRGGRGETKTVKLKRPLNVLGRVTGKGRASRERINTLEMMDLRRGSFCCQIKTLDIDILSTLVGTYSSKILLAFIRL